MPSLTGSSRRASRGAQPCYGDPGLSPGLLLSRPRRASLLPPAGATWAALAAIWRTRYTIFMSFGRALFVAWCVWIGTLVVSSVVMLLLDKTEWRVAVVMLSILVGFLAFVYSRRARRRVDG